MARVILNNETFTVFNNSNVEILGGSGAENVLIGGTSSAVSVAQSVERVDVSGNVADFTYQAAGNQVNILRAGAVVATVTPQEGTGTQVRFADGSAVLKVTALGAATLGSAAIGTAAAAVTVASVGSSFDTGTKSSSVNLGGGTTTPPTTAQTFTLTSSAAVNEGGTITFGVKTTNVAAGNYNYTLGGTISAADITGGLLNGTFYVDPLGSGNVPVAIVADSLTEGSETLTLTIGGATSTAVTVNDTSASSAPAGSTQLTTGVDNFLGTTGDDVFNATAATWQVGDVINGGTGNDTLNATLNGAGPQQSLTSLAGVETLNLTASPNPSTLDLTGVIGVTAINNLNSANNANLTVSGVGAPVNTTITNSQAATTITYAAAVTAATAVTDAAILTVSGVSAGSSYTANGIDLLTINSTGSTTNTLGTLGVASAATVTIGGDRSLVIGGNVGGALLTSVNASGFTGSALTISAGAGLGATAASTVVVNGVTVTAPAAATTVSTITTQGNNDVVNLGAGNATVVTGAGNDTITGGAGVNTITPGVGNDVINVTTGTDTIRYEGFTNADADTINGTTSKTVIGLGLGQVAAAATATTLATNPVVGTFGIVQTGATTLSFPGVSGAGTGTAIVAQTIAPNATATTGTTVLGASNVLFLSGALTNGTAGGVMTALGTTANAGITTAVGSRFVLVTYSVGNIAQVWSVAETGANNDIDEAELTLVATLNNVNANTLTAANFATYTTAAAAGPTAITSGQAITLSGILNTVSNITNAAGQFLTAADDTVTLPIGLLPTAAAGSTTQGLTLIDANDRDSDTLNATVLSPNWDANTSLVNIENLNLTYSVADNGFDMTSMAIGTTTVNIGGTANTGAITAANGRTFGLNAGYVGIATVAGATTATLNLGANAGTTAATSPAFEATAGLTATTINVNGSTGLRLGNSAGATTNELAATNLITLRGTGNLTIHALDTEFDTARITATSPVYSGSLTLAVTGNGNIDLSDATSPSTGVRRINIPAAYAGQITLNESNTGSVTIGVAATSTANWAVAQAGTGQSDTVTVSFGGLTATAAAALGSGNINAVSIENLTLAGNTSAVQTLTLGSVTLTDGAGTQAVTITNPGNVAFTAGAGNSTITADTVNTTGVAGSVGTLAVPLTLANTSGVSFTGGAGATAVTGSAAADVITTGIGNDIISTGGGADIVNSGAGNDFIVGGAGNEIINAGTGADTVTAGPGVDLINLGTGDGAADVLIQFLGDSAVFTQGAGTTNSVATTSFDIVTGAAAGDGLAIGGYTAGTVATLAGGLTLLSTVTASTTVATTGGFTLADNAAFVIRGIYNSAAATFVGSGTGTSSLVVYDADPTAGVEAYEAVVLVGYTGTVTAPVNAATGLLVFG